MIEIIAFNTFSKRKNSTKQPIDSEGTAMQVSLKGECSLVNPSFFISGVERWCYIKAFGFYYFVDRIAYDVNGAQYINCSIDVLASFKQQIQNTNAYIVYSSTGFNRWIRDDRCPIIIKDSEYLSTASTIVLNNYSLFEATDNEIVIFSTVSKEQGIAHWVTTEETFTKLINQLVDAGDSIWESLQKLFGDAIGSIIQVRRMPITNEAINSIAEGPYDVYFGTYPVPDFDVPTEPLGLKKLSQTYISLKGSIGIPVTYTDFRFTEPYCHARMSLPFVGVVDVSLSDFAPSGGIHWELDLDLLTGSIIYTLYDEILSKPIASYSGQCGTQIPIASQQIATSSQIVAGIGGSLLTFGLGTLAGNAHMAIGGATASVMSVANAFYSSAHKSTSIVGSYSGGRAEFANRQIRLTVEKFKTANEPSNLTELEGRPVCKVDRIGEYTGYVQTQKFNIDIPAISEVRDLINSAMDKGVYIE